MMENHSFDDYFSHLGKYANRTDIESASDAATNPRKTGPTPGGTIPYQHAPHLCTLDTNHEWAGTHLEYDDGKMDGFVEANEGWATDQLPPTSDPALASGDRAMYPALTGRDANADPLVDLFDFSAPKFLTPPKLTEPTIDPTELEYCKKTYGKP